METVQIDRIVTKLVQCLQGPLPHDVGATSTRAEVTIDVLYTTPGTFMRCIKNWPSASPSAPRIKVKFRNPWRATRRPRSKCA